MIQKFTNLYVTDNSGAIAVRVFQTYPGNRKIVPVGSIVRHSVKKIHRILPWGKQLRGRRKRIICRSQCGRSWIVQTSYQIPYIDGATLRFSKNRVLLVKRKRGIRIYRGRRIYGLTTRAVNNERTINLFRICI
uniref:Large ribosomal subunit protein uL14m n=1 Tax=Nyctotherus ovalis TaxID=70075 RepID=RL14H_NYCOV|nr:RecName: Full=Large ribosomal subunit protein uL14m; AltName: Full=60S ribosomal protein L14, hydrogenosomal [Nyctotherus ovalis]CAI38855.1 ribosomal protein L14 [Nyctotherus ovalis]